LAFSVSEELAIDDIGDAPLEATQRFLVGLGLGELAFVVGAAGTAAVADLGDRRHMDRMVNRRLPLRFTQWTGRPALPLSSGAVPL
jgi:hypothetical protein